MTSSSRSVRPLAAKQTRELQILISCNATMQRAWNSIHRRTGVLSARYVICVSRRKSRAGKEGRWGRRATETYVPLIPLRRYLRTHITCVTTYKYIYLCNVSICLTLHQVLQEPYMMRTCLCMVAFGSLMGRSGIKSRGPTRRAAQTARIPTYLHTYIYMIVIRYIYGVGNKIG